MRTRALVILVLLIVLAAAAAFFSYETARAPRPTDASLAADLLPLYGAAWNAPHAVTMYIGTTSVAGMEIDAVAATDTMNIASATDAFARYYDGKLLAAGWQKDIALEANGPGAGLVGYRDGSSSLAIVGFKSVFKNTPADAPEQCPCDVTLFLFSSAQ